MDVTKSYEFIRFGAVAVTKPYEFIGFGAMDVTKPYELTSSTISGGPRAVDSGTSVVPGRPTRRSGQYATVCYAIWLPGRRSVLRAGFRPDSMVLLGF